MDVKIDTVLSRFLFPFPYHHDGDAESDAVTRGTGRAGNRLLSTASLSSHPPAERGMDGTFAFVSAAGSVAESTSTSTPPVLDLTRLASNLWYSELKFSPGSSATPTACMVFPPPCVFGNQVCRGASLSVFPSGLVRLFTYGGEEATLRTAGRVRQMLREAHSPVEVRRAAREERRLLRAVFAEETMDENGVEEEAGMSLAAALAGGDEKAVEGNVSRRTPFPSLFPQTKGARATRSTTRRREEEEEEGADADVDIDENDLDALRDIVKIDFMKAIATPCWPELLRLRESLFASPADSLEGGGDGEERERKKVDDGAPSRASSSANQHEAYASGRLTRLNVRGDAPLAWWRWFLSASLSTSSSSGKKVREAAELFLSETQERGVPHRGSASAAAPSLLPTTLSEEEADGGFWGCEGHRDVLPTSPAAQRFVAYLRYKRSLIAHHVLSFKVSRNARQSGVHLSVEWNKTAAPRVVAAVAPPRVPLTLAATVTGHESAQSGSPASEGGIRGEVAVRSAAGGAPRSLNLGRAAQQPSITGVSAPHGGTEGWVTEASAANFFLESTFIAESTTPYGLESTRPSLELTPQRGSAAAVQVKNQESTVDSFSGTPAVAAGSRSLSRREGEKPRKVRKTEPATEQVSCILHSTGSVVVSAGSEVAIQQVVDILIVPFLVATANMTPEQRRRD